MAGMNVQLFDNVKDLLQDDLKNEIRKGSKLSIAAACFSMTVTLALTRLSNTRLCFPGIQQ